ncbi:MAG TPA: dienelactone hydrolase family protein [Streptosporangiaceae bacterium]|jgi:carboxymethylenebutenolidase|nr:dienelactone hydrolase family protein [Streptosporangiaceae bacterium]
MNEALTAETVTIKGYEDAEIEAYLARPEEADSFGGVVVIHHLPGYDSSTKEIARRFAAHGYAALMPNLYYHDSPGVSPDDAAAAARAKGGVPDDQVVGDVAGAAEYLRGLPGSNGKIGVIGYCSGGRQSFLAACSLTFDAAVDCYGGAVVHVPEGAPASMKPLIGLSENLSCPLLGLFGADDQFPTPAETAELSRTLENFSKPHEFHTFNGAGHAFFSVDRASYRVEAAVEGWDKIWAFFGQHLAGKA